MDSCSSETSSDTGWHVIHTKRPLRRIQVYVDRKKRNDSLILQIDAKAFGSSASLELDGALLKPLA